METDNDRRHKFPPKAVTIPPGKFTFGIDSEGYWTVLYNKNETPERLTVNGQPVKANGESGKTPTFNVDSEGYYLYHVLVSRVR